MELTAEEIIERLGLSPHPEGGYFCETFRDPKTNDGRSVGTAIYFLLKEGEVSRWHQVDAAEIWHHYAGDPLELGMAEGENEAQVMILGPDLKAGHQPQLVVPAGWWQQARSLGKWTLVGCTVSPAFEFEGFQMAPDFWSPGQKLPSN